MPRISRRRFVVAATGPAVLALIAGGFLVAQGAKADNTIAVEVNAGSSLGTVPSTGLGINTGVYDGDLNNSAASAALSNAGVDALRYPGGSTSDAYDWQNNTTVSGQGYANPSNDFDDFMGIANKVGASPVITVNYGSGTAAEAAAWVKYADVTKNYGIKYWELGNEVYGDGTYGADWEYNTKSKGATAYADNIEDYITQMKAADSNIKVGAVLTAYGDWPDGLVAGSYGDSADWNETVLKTDGSKLDFVILHDYPAWPECSRSTRTSRTW
jgi:alpha-L-arabinofuranosidase